MDTVWKFCIRSTACLPDKAQGWVRAKSIEQALALVGRQDAFLFPKDSTWPGAETEDVYWTNGSKSSHTAGGQGKDPNTT